LHFFKLVNSFVLSVENVCHGVNDHNLFVLTLLYLILQHIDFLSLPWVHSLLIEILKNQLRLNLMLEVVLHHDVGYQALGE
jgi:hypothetical protein